MEDCGQAIWGSLKSVYHKMGGIEPKKIVTLLVVLFLAYYVLEGFGRTVITEFKIPQGLQKDLSGIDGGTLTHQLILELQSLRTSQEAAANLQLNLVKGIESLHLRGDPLEIQLSARINTDYRTLTEKVGSVEWGPLKIPVTLLLRPFQKVIQQKMMELSIHRDGGHFYLSAIRDDGRVWQAADHEVSFIELTRGAADATISKLVRILAYKISSQGSMDSGLQESWVGFCYYHQGIQHLLSYYGRAESDKNNVPDELDQAAQAFERAIHYNPQDVKSRYNSVLTSLERSFHVAPGDRIKLCQSSLERVKNLMDMGKLPRISLEQLLIANYFLLAYAYFQENNYDQAIRNYEAALKLLPKPSHLRAYVYNNLGLAYGHLGKAGPAIEAYEKSLADHPSYARAYLNLGNTLAHMKYFASAERACALAIRKRPEYLTSYYNLGNLYFEVQRDEAFGMRDQNSLSCLHVQAANSFERYVWALQDAGVTRNLSPDENESLYNAKGLLPLVRPGDEGIQKPKEIPPYGECLTKYLPEERKALKINCLE